MDNQIDTIGALVRKMETEDDHGNTLISKYVNFSMRETIEKTDAYLNSKHISGDKDSMGRDKPFFNIVTAISNIWFRATDIDTKNILVRATRKAQYTLALVASILIQQFMKTTFFGIFLNQWGLTLARYGSAVSKFVEKDGELITTVIPWNRLICDPVDFDNNAVIEKLWMTPAQLMKKKEYDQDMVKQLLDSLEIRETMDGQDKDNKSDFIEIYEVHGDLPKSYRTGMDADDDIYEQQMFVVSFVAKKQGALRGDKPQWDDYNLFAGKEAKSPYQIDHLIPQEGRTLSIGSVENSFESQWMVNHNQKAIKDQLDLASKLIFQTSDGNFVGQNALTAIETGDILIWDSEKGSPITEVNNTSHDIVALQSQGLSWKEVNREINGVAESMVTQAKSGTAWRQTQAELSEAHSLFELMTENKGLGIKKMMREHIIPFYKKKMDNTDEISDILEEHQITKIDSMYVPAEATRRVNNAIIDDVLTKTPEDIAKGNLITPEQQEATTLDQEQVVQKQLSQFGNQRFIKPSDIKNKTWKEATKDLEWELEIDIVGESKDTQAIMATLNTYLQFLVNKQGQPLTSEEKLVSNKILALSGGISPVEISSVQSQPQATPEIPQQ